MAGLTHSTVVVVPDDPTYPVGTDEWNANHLFTGGAQGQVLFQGAASAISSSPDFTWDDAAKTLHVQAGPDLFMEITPGDFTVEGEADFNFTSGGDISFSASTGNVDLEGDTVSLLSLNNTLLLSGNGNGVQVGGPAGADAIQVPGSLTVNTRTGTPATDAVFDSAGVLCERALPVAAQPISWGNVGG